MTLLCAFFIYAFWRKILSVAVALVVFVLMYSAFAVLYLVWFCFAHGDQIAARARVFEKNPAEAFGSEMQYWWRAWMIGRNAMEAHRAATESAYGSGNERLMQLSFKK